MDQPSLDDRVSALERRLTELTAEFGRSPHESPAPATDTFWALERLREQIAAKAGSGAVLYTGTVDLPTGEHYDWQFGAMVDDLMEIDWAGRAGTLNALGHPVRMRLLQRVLAGTRTAGELATDEGLGTTGQVYHHLRQLVSAGWLQTSPRGGYTVSGERVVPLLVILSGV
jgi:Helix-turn-helix domain